MWVVVHREAPPVGFVEVTTFPAGSVATHNVSVGQATPDNDVPYMDALVSTVVAAQAEAPPAGFLEVSTSPGVSVATHNVVDGQETSPRPAWHVRCGSPPHDP
jgi:hypothetical protein